MLEGHGWWVAGEGRSRRLAVFEHLSPLPWDHSCCKTQSEIWTVTNGLVLAGPQLEACPHRETSLSVETQWSAQLGDLQHPTRPCPWLWQGGETWPCWGAGWDQPSGTLPFHPRRVSGAPEGGVRTPRVGDMTSQVA